MGTVLLQACLMRLLSCTAIFAPVGRLASSFFAPVEFLGGLQLFQRMIQSWDLSRHFRISGPFGDMCIDFFAMFDAAFRRKECGPRDDGLLCVAPVHHACLPDQRWLVDVGGISRCHKGVASTALLCRPGSSTTGSAANLRQRCASWYAPAVKLKGLGHIVGLVLAE